MAEESGRRERKKAQTRKSIGDAALGLFLEQGFEATSVREIADAADVSVTTLFNHFPSKEALAFDDEERINEALTAAVRDRSTSHSVVSAIREFVSSWANEVGSYPHAAAFRAMIEQTPALQAYGRRAWLQHEAALSHAIAEAGGAPDDDIQSIALARFALDAFELAHHSDNPSRAVDDVFALIENGMPERLKQPLGNSRDALGDAGR